MNKLPIEPRHHAIWNDLRIKIQSVFSEEIFNVWFQDMRYTRHDENQIEFTVPNDFAIIWIQDNYLDILIKCVCDFFGFKLKILLTIESQQSNKPEKIREQNLNFDSEIKDSKTYSRFSNDLKRNLLPSNSRINRTKKNEFQLPKLNEKNTFSNFVVGSNNDMAHAACLGICERLGRSYNPLFLYGNTGLGKTHLMQAVAHHVIAKNPLTRVEYISCEKFTNDYIKAIQENSLVQFRKHYRGVDVLLIDDIQFLTGKERTQEEFFHNFNDLFESQKQIVLSSDRPAGEIKKLETRLMSRFQWGMVADIQAPELETRIAILTKKAENLDVFIPDNIINFLAEKISRNIRRMEGALTRISSYATLSRDTIDLSCVKRLLHDLLAEESQQIIHIEDIKKKVVSYYRLQGSDMESRRRPAKIAFPRQIAMYLCRILTDHSLHEIGDSFGGRDHGTVIYACKTVEDIMDHDISVKNAVNHLKKQLSSIH